MGAEDPVREGEREALLVREQGGDLGEYVAKE